MIVVFAGGTVAAIGSVELLTILAAVVVGMIPTLLFVSVVGAFHLWAWGGGRGWYLSPRTAICLQVALGSAAVGIVLATLSFAGWLASALGFLPAMPYYRGAYIIGYCLTTAALAFLVFHRLMLPNSWLTQPDLTGRHDSEWAQSLEAGIAAAGDGRLVEAEILFRAALDSPQASSIGGQVLTVSADNLAAVCAARGRYTEAISLYERALPVWMESAMSGDPKDDPDVAAALINLAGVYIALERHADAAALAEWASAILLRESEDPEADLDDRIVHLWCLRDARGSVIPTPFGIEMAHEAGRYSAIWRDLRALLLDPSSRLRLVRGNGSDIDANDRIGHLQAHLDLLLQRLLGPDHKVRASR